MKVTELILQCKSYCDLVVDRYSEGTVYFMTGEFINGKVHMCDRRIIICLMVRIVTGEFINVKVHVCDRRIIICPMVRIVYLL